MPLHKTISIDTSSQILIWKITESLEELLAEVQLNEKSILRLRGMKSELHQRAFLSVRLLLSVVGFSDFDLYYDENGKPHLLPNISHTEPIEVSISHSHQFSTIILSSKKVGIDIELQRDKIIKIAAKFCESELNFLDINNTAEYIKKLTMIWGAKESIFKIVNKEGISFKNHIQIQKFEIGDKMTTATLKLDNFHQQFFIYFEEIDSISESLSLELTQNFSLVYAFENNPKLID